MKSRLWIVMALILVTAILGGCAATTATTAPTTTAATTAGTTAATTAAATTAEAKPMKITFVTPLIAHPVWDVCKAGFEAAAKDLNFDGQYVGPQGLDGTEMVNQIEIAMASKVDGIITMALNDSVFKPVLEKAQKQGISIVFVGADAPNCPRMAFFGTDQKNIGKIGGTELMKQMAGKPINAVVMQSTMENSFAINARDGYLETLKDYAGGFKMVVNEACNSDMKTAMEKYESIFQTYPEINTVIGVCGEAGPAAGKVIEELGLQDKITVMAIDDVAETLDMVRNGQIRSTVAQNFYLMGYNAAKVICDKVRDGKDPAQVINDTGAMIVDKSNVDTYQAEWWSGRK